MRKSFLILCGVFTFLILMNCSNKNSKIVGKWKLTSWAVDLPLDINKDSITSLNLLDELECKNNETLVFDEHGIVMSNNTFHPTVEIGLNKITKDYIFNVDCPEGVISNATSYIVNNDGTISINDEVVNIGDNFLTRTFKNAYNIYDENFVNVLDKRDLVLIYSKI